MRQVALWARRIAFYGILAGCKLTATAGDAGPPPSDIAGTSDEGSLPSHTTSTRKIVPSPPPGVQLPRLEHGQWIDRSSRIAPTANRLGFALYARAPHADGNFVLSPVGVAIALTMACLGAHGE